MAVHRTPAGSRAASRRSQRDLPAVLLVDLGGVVVRDPRPLVVAELLARRPRRRDRTRAVYYRLSRDLDAGRIALRTMHRLLVRSLDVTIPFVDFRELVGRRSLSTIPSVVRRLRALKSHGTVRVAFASNVSRPVWSALVRRFHVNRLADEEYLSFRLGVLKPSPRFFRLALRGLGLPGERVLFLDDSRANVRAARREGLRAVHVPTARAVIRALDGVRRETRRGIGGSGGFSAPTTAGASGRTAPSSSGRPAAPRPIGSSRLGGRSRAASTSSVEHGQRGAVALPLPSDPPSGPSGSPRSGPPTRWQGVK